MYEYWLKSNDEFKDYAEFQSYKDNSDVFKEELSKEQAINKQLRAEIQKFETSNTINVVSISKDTKDVAIQVGDNTAIIKSSSGDNNYTESYCHLILEHSRDLLVIYDLLVINCTD